MCDNVKNCNIVYFQDFFSMDSKEMDEVDPAEAFFELANAPVVGFKIDNHIKQISAKKKIKEVRIRQISDCQSHTGGIVWETSYFLSIYLTSKHSCLGKVLEVGAGCGTFD